MFRIVLFFCVSYLFAAGELLVSNYSFAATSFGKGKVLVFSRGDANGGFSLLEFGIGAPLRILSSEFSIFENDVEYTAVHDGILSDTKAELRRVPFVKAGKLGSVLPMYELDSTGLFRKPAGFISMRGVEEGGLSYIPLELPRISYLDTSFSLMDNVLSAFAYDSLSNVLWSAMGTSGLLRYDVSKGFGNVQEKTLVLNKKEQRLDTLTYGMELKFSNTPSILGLALEPEKNVLWLATSTGLWVQEEAQSAKLKLISGLEKSRVTGVWLGGTPTQIIAETSEYKSGHLENKLWRSLDGKNFSEVVFRDTTGKKIKGVYDGTDYSVSDVAFVGKQVFVAVRTVGGAESGLLKLDSLGAIPWEAEENQWLYGFEAGVVDRNTIIFSVNDWLLPNGGTGLAVTTYGNGISVSADSGKTWQPVLNQAAVGKNLSSIRMVPSVIAADGESLIAYNLSKESKVTIEIFSYDMRKVRTIVKDALRPASAGRSTNAAEDLWDGRDDMGRAVTMGIYYVRVKDNHGHVGWGKVMTLGGR